MIPNDQDAAGAPTPNEQAKTVLRPLFDVMGIERIIVVDDELSTALDLPDITGAIKARVIKKEFEPLKAIDSLKTISFEAPEEIWRPKLEKLWASLAPKDREGLAGHLGVETTTGDVEGGRGILSDLLGDYELTFMTLGQWRDEKDRILGELESRPSLFLFDQDMQKNDGSDEEGMKQIGSLLRGRSTEPMIYCGLFTNHVTAETEHTSHSAFVERFQLQHERNRFAVISKEHLRQEPSSLAMRLKRVAISPWCEKLKVQLVNAVKDAVMDAAAKVERLDVYDFEQIVFQSSYKEGVWEPDTLLRVFGLYHREAARTRAKDDPILNTAADKVRSVISVPYRPKDWKGTQSLEVAQLDLYEQSEYLLSHKMPLDIGDVFQKTGGNKRYILLEQPCDLMVRGDTGKRNAEAVVLAEVVERNRGDRIRDSYVELEYFLPDVTKQCFVDLSTTASVPAWVLDLCVFSDDGTAKMSLGAACPAGMIPAWKLRHQLVLTQATGVIQKFREHSNGASAAVKAILMANLTGSVAGCLKGEVRQNPDLLYNLKRVARVKQPRSGSLLREIAYYKARDAFDHDLMRDLGNEACGADSCN